MKAETFDIIYHITSMMTLHQIVRKYVSTLQCHYDNHVSCINHFAYNSENGNSIVCVSNYGGYIMMEHGSAAFT